MKIRCYFNCKHSVVSTYDPSPSGVALGYGFLTEYECAKENEMPDYIEEIEFENQINKHDGTYRRCPFYKSYTQAQMLKDMREESEYYRAMYEQQEEK